MPLDLISPTGSHAYLDLEEITGQPAEYPSDPTSELSYDPGSAIRHSGWRRDRQHIFEAMKELGWSEQRITRFASCGSNAWLMQEKNDCINCRGVGAGGAEGASPPPILGAGGGQEYLFAPSKFI